jgi:large subunit ribosomal protein L5
MVIDIKKSYKEKITSLMSAEFSYKNIHQVPKIVKITVSSGLGLNAQNKIFLQKAIDEFRIITGQQPVITKAKKSIAGFKIRKDMLIGLKVTLRREKLYSFLTRLIHLVFPRIRDFRGFSSKGFDQFGNYTLGLSEQLVFPEISYESVDQKRGFNITIVTTAKNTNEAYFLLEKIGFPFKIKNI